MKKLIFILLSLSNFSFTMDMLFTQQLEEKQKIAPLPYNSLFLLINDCLQDPVKQLTLILRGHNTDYNKNTTAFINDLLTTKEQKIAQKLCTKEVIERDLECSKTAEILTQKHLSYLNTNQPPIKHSNSPCNEQTQKYNSLFAFLHTTMGESRRDIKARKKLLQKIIQKNQETSNYIYPLEKLALPDTNDFLTAVSLYTTTILQQDKDCAQTTKKVLYYMSLKIIKDPQTSDQQRNYLANLLLRQQNLS